MAHFYFVAQDIETTGVCAVYCGVHICCIFSCDFPKILFMKKKNNFTIIDQ